MQADGASLYLSTENSSFAEVALTFAKEAVADLWIMFFQL